MHRMAIHLLVGLTVILLIVSCSSSGSSVSLPDTPREQSSAGHSSHMLWGLWDVSYDVKTNTMEFVQARGPDFHMNVLPFIEPPPLAFLTLESEPLFNPVNNTVTVDVGLKHPFTGLNEFAGFDVKGIVISRADYPASVPTSKLKMPGPNRLRLLNADGYTRLWNPDEFPYDKAKELFCYKDGLLGAPDSFGNYDAQINGYKYFCDGLAPTAEVTTMDFATRGVFFPGSKNVRNYIISLPQGLIFQYAIDASWEFPKGTAPWDIPGDYPITANCPEAYFIDYSHTGIMFAGDLMGTYDMEIHVYDHQPGTIQGVYIEAQDLYTDPWTASFEYSTTYFDVYSVHLDNKNQAPEGIYPGLISVIDSEKMSFPTPFPPDLNFTAYRTFDIEVMAAPEVVVTDMEDAAIKGYPNFEGLTYTYDAIEFDAPPTFDTGYFLNPNGPWQFSYAYTDIVTMESLDAAPPDPEVTGFAGLYPPEISHFWKAAYNFGPDTFQPYFGEAYDLTAHKRLVYGVTESTLIGGTYIFRDAASAVVPMEFQYPYYAGIDFTADGQYIIPPPPIPIEIFELKWRVRGIGEGDLTLTPGGTTYKALLLRHDLTVELGNTEFAWAIMYEWLDNDGRPLAMITSGEAPGNLNNYDHPTGFIYGDSIYMVLQGY